MTKNEDGSVTLTREEFEGESMDLIASLCYKAAEEGLMDKIEILLASTCIPMEMLNRRIFGSRTDEEAQKSSEKAAGVITELAERVREEMQKRGVSKVPVNETVETIMMKSRGEC